MNINTVRTLEMRLIAVRNWVIQELVFIGKEGNARSLQAYWATGEVEHLVDTLEAVRLPDPMEENL